jgi:hypothetical protein
MRIPVEQQILAVVFSLILLLVTVQLVRKHRLREEYALVWLGASLVIFVLTVFDPLVGFLAGLFAVSYAPTLIVVFGVLFCLIILLSQSVLISTQADRIRDLAQSVGLLEWRLHQLQRRESTEVATEAGHFPQNQFVDGSDSSNSATHRPASAEMYRGYTARTSALPRDEDSSPSRGVEPDIGKQQGKQLGPENSS